MNYYECIIKLNNGVVITEVIQANSSFVLEDIAKERVENFFEILYVKPLS